MALDSALKTPHPLERREKERKKKKAKEEIGCSCELECVIYTNLALFLS